MVRSRMMQRCQKRSTTIARAACAAIPARRLAVIAIAVCEAGAASLIGGCASGDDRELRTRVVSLGEFSATSASGDAVNGAATQLASGGDADRDGVESVASSSTATQPQLTAVDSDLHAPRLRPGDQIVIDRVVGQISGRPIFADDLLRPIADQLRAEAERLDTEAFIQRANVIIREHLTLTVLNELFLAEAEASLTPEEKVGVLHFVREMQERVISQTGAGSRSRAEGFFRDQELTLEEYVAMERDRGLIRRLIDERIQPRVIVAWKDVEREYERRRAEFMPPASVTFNRLRLSTQTQQDLIEQVKGRFAEGAEFGAVSADLGLDEYTALYQPTPVGSGGLRNLEMPEAYRAAVAELSAEVGEVAGPIELEGRIVWLHIASIDQPEGRSLFDVQRQLIEELRLKREVEERERFVRSLLEKGIYDELEEMARRVLAVAIMRYAP